MIPASDELAALATMPALLRCALIGLAVSAAGQHAPRASAQASDAVRVKYTIKEDWKNGFTADLAITNEADWAIGDWRVSFTFAPQIDNVWNARVVSRTGATYVLGPVEASWDDGELAPGETVTIGFVARGSAGDLPTAGSLNGAPLLIPGSSPAPRPAVPAVVSAPHWPAEAFAPYVDATAFPPVDLAAASSELGVRRFRLGFVVAASATSAVPTWGGTRSATSYRLGEVNALRRQGGDVAIAFGGAAGTELALAARSHSELAGVYKQVVDAYGARSVDFDLEGAALADRPSIERRTEALVLLQEWSRAEGAALDIWLTLPVSPRGLTPAALSVVRTALARGVEIRGVNAMAMDYGSAVAPNPDGRMGALAIQAAQSLEVQLAGVYEQLGKVPSRGDIWQSIGITPMIGRNDVLAEVFKQSDARQLLAFASEKSIGLLSFWSFNRDRACDDPETQVSPLCSGISQRDREFTQIFRTYGAPR
jgi:hypothetical protein